MENVSCADPSLGVTGNSDRPAFASTYAIAGRLIYVVSPDEHSQTLFRRYFSGWHAQSVSNSIDSQPHAAIFVRRGIPPQAPQHVPSFEVADGGLCHADKTTYYFRNHSSVVVAGGHSPHVDVWFGEHEPVRERQAIARLIFNAAMTAMRRCGLYQLHGAGLIAPDGAGMIISGPSGSGKSTFATQLASVGWQYLSDDSLLLGASERGIQAHALRRVFALTESGVTTARGFDVQLPPTNVESFDPLKQRFEPAEVFPDRFAIQCLPKKLFFSRITHEAATRNRTLSPAETMAQLLRMCPWAAYDKAVAEPHLRVLEKLARQATGFELLAGKDLLGDPDLTADYLLRPPN
jgi:hypothetical protein